MDHHATAAPVRLRITLPTVDQLDVIGNLEPAHQTPPCRPVKTAQRLERASETPPTRTTGDRRRSRDQKEPSTVMRDCVSTISPEMDSTRIDIISSPMLATNPAFRGECRTSSVIGFIPATLPSQFMKAKPRLYRASTRPSTSCAEMHYTVICGTIDAEKYPSSYDSGGDGASAIPHHRSNINTQPAGSDQLSIVAIADSGSPLRLDYRQSKYDRELRIESKHDSSVTAAIARHPTTISWSALTAEQQITELMAASRSRCVTEQASSMGFVLPTATDFSGSDVRAQLRVRQFKRWYLSTPDVRPGFLIEELRCAVGNNLILMELSRVCGSLPQRGDLSSNAWIDFTTWYSTGISIGDDKMMKTTVNTLPDRLVERTRFLQSRLQALESFEDDHEHSHESDEATYFVFDSLPHVHIITTEDSPTLWINQSSCNQIRELQLALQSATIQSAALAEDVLLPDLAISLTQSCDLALLAKDFVGWWAAPDNLHRQGFLEDEVKAAASDTAVKRALEEDTENVNKSAIGFADRYFHSHLAREVYLENKLQQIRITRRIHDVMSFGMTPSPLVCELEIPPSAIVFSFPRVTVDEVEHVCGVGIVEESSATVCEDDQEIVVVMSGVEVYGELDVESKRRQDELALMAAEDALSHYLNSGYESTSDDEQEDDGVPINHPQRTDFTYSYFFGNLPKAFRINSGGWIAGSGVDNGDEEIEEEERLERERKHQEMLDRLEAERIAEAERQAELQRIEKEREEKALQFRRLRLLELKKILTHQAELEMQRAREIEFQNMMRERADMMVAERETRLWKARLEGERSAMIAEDERAKLIRRAERDTRKDALRKMLAELTAMDAEDHRSAAFQHQQFDHERRQEQRTEFLKELYEPFEPYYPSSKVASEEFLPIIRHRRLQRGKRPKAAYTLSFAETVAIDEVEYEPYVARDSRKLRVLMGLSVTNRLSRRMMRVPSAQDIIGGRQVIQLMLPSTSWTEEDRYESVSETEWQNPKPRTNQTDQPPQQRLLPNIVHWTAESDDKLTDLTCSKPSDYSTMERPNQRVRKCKTKRTDSTQRQSTALPFFRGNFVVKGEGQFRSQYHAPH